MTAERTRVGVNLTWLIPDVVGGSEESTVRQLTAVMDRAPGADLVLFVTPDFATAHAAVCARAETVVMPAGRMIRRARRPGRVVLEHSWLVTAARRARIELMHHAGGTAPLRTTKPYTLTIHDLQPLDIPGNFSVTKRAYLRGMLGRSGRGARRVAVPTDAMRLRVIDRLGLSPGVVSVVPWCVDPVDLATVEARTGEARRRLGIGPRFILMPAVTHPHKNHLTALAAFDRAAEVDPTLELVLAGGEGRAEAEVVERWQRLRSGERVHRLGRVDREDIDALYAAALATVFPTRYEGFGLPAIEAMAHGCPVICSDIPALREVTGAAVAGEGAAVLLDPDDVEGWAREIGRVTSTHDTSVRETMVAAGLRQAATFTADRTASATLALWS